MTGFFTMLKSNMKLLLRNKGFLCLLIILPLFSVLLLNIRTDDSFSLDGLDHHHIHEIEIGKRVEMVMNHNRLSIVVNDSDQSPLADFLLQQLADTGSYEISRYRTDIVQADEAEAEAVAYANRNAIGAVLYIPPHLEENIRQAGSEPAVYLFETSEDGRILMLQESLNTILNSLTTYQILVAESSGGKNSSALIDLLGDITKQSPKKEFVTFNFGEEVTLTLEQQQYKSNIGYSLAVISIGFLFTGIFIGSVVLEERHNLTFTRILLTKAHIVNYVLIKLVLSFIATLIQIGIMWLSISMFVTMDFGLSMESYLFFIFGIGLIFNLLSVVASIVSDNLLSASYFSFFFWSISAMLSGLYFPLETVGDWWRKAALFMPPYWVVRCSEMAMLGQNDTYPTFMLIVSGFIVIILSVGFLGIRTRSNAHA